MKNEKLSDFFTHLGWALWGQECLCGKNPFNWLAYRLDPYMNGPGQYDDDTLEHHQLTGRTLDRVGRFFCHVGNITMPDYEEVQNG